MPKLSVLKTPEFSLQISVKNVGVGRSKRAEYFETETMEFQLIRVLGFDVQKK